MKTAVALFAALVVVSALPATTPTASAEAKAGACPAAFNHDFRQLHASKTVNICKDFAGKPMLIVNTASNCGFTPQYKGLEALHQKYKGKGLVVVGFASNDFNQETADEAKSAEICFLNNGVTFTVLAATHVKGADANPVFKTLNAQASEPKWNFNKYLVTADGKVAKYFPSNVTPDSAEFNTAVEALLK
jgi:glutathione peroxidase